MSPHHLEMLDLESGCALLEATHPELADIFRTAALPAKNAAAAFGRVDYKYGDTVVGKGQFIVPCTCDDCNAKRSHFPADIPLGMILENNLEITRVRGAGQRRSLRLLRKGEVFGIFEALDRHNGVSNLVSFEIHSGARTFIADVVEQNKPIINHIESLYSDCVKRGEHGRNAQVDWWKVVCTWTRASKNPWTTKLIYVTNALMRASESRLTPHLYRIAWQQMQDKRQEADESLFRSITDPALKASLHHLLGVATEKLVGYTPVTGNDASGPLLDFLKNLNETTGKKHKSILPLLLEPAYYAPAGDALPIFHSLSAGPLKVSDRFSSTMSDVVKQLRILPNDQWVAYARDDSEFDGKKISDYGACLFGQDFRDQQAINEHTKLRTTGFFTAFIRLKAE